MSTDSSRLEVLVLGGGYGGVLAANRIAGTAGRRARITLVSDRDEMVHRVRLHEALAGHPFKRYPLKQLLARRVRVVHGRVTRISAASRTIDVAGAGTLPYDLVLVTLGSRIDLRVPGAREHAGWLASPETAAAGAARLAALADGDAVAVIGGGLTAIETAVEIAEAHPRLRVTMLAQTLGRGLSTRGLAYLRTVLEETGVVVRQGVTVEEIGARDVGLSGGERVPAALSVWAAGFAPAGPDIETDLPLDPVGRILVGGDLRAAGAASVFVAGDAAAPPPGLDFYRMACATALPSAAHAADGIAALIRGDDPQALQLGYRMQCISLGRRRGLIQRCDPRDQPVEDGLITGRVGAMIKELVCRFAIGSLRLERRWAGVFWWPRDVPALPSGERLALPTAPPVKDTAP
jgi:NADH:ubiquinone reductase (H+-translocating)